MQGVHGAPMGLQSPSSLQLCCCRSLWATGSKSHCSHPWQWGRSMGAADPPVGGWLFQLLCLRIVPCPACSCMGTAAWGPASLVSGGLGLFPLVLWSRGRSRGRGWPCWRQDTLATRGAGVPA